MKVLAIIGTATKKGTWNGVKNFEKKLQENLREINEELEMTYISLQDYNIEFCKGCKVCFDRGEEFCPVQDDIQVIVEHMKKADLIILASPNYAFHISGQMKNFIDRISYYYHRPYFFNTRFTAIVAQAVFGGSKLLKYLQSVGENLGGDYIKGSVINTIEPMTKKQRLQNEKVIDKHVSRVKKSIIKNKIEPNPIRYMMFHIARSNIQYGINDEYKDYRYYQQKGWFESNYHYSYNPNIFVKLLGVLGDRIGKRIGAKFKQNRTNEMNNQ